VNRFRLRRAQVRGRAFFYGLCFWSFLAALQAIGGAVTDQTPTAVAVESQR
jgi:hypothetical protein